MLYTPAPYRPPSRRAFVRNLSLSLAFLSVRGLYAEELALTPRQTEGPFYPDHLRWIRTMT
jgi:protocatechuate 3,4-dioxygenase beta subunit